jgi:carbon-monoxide dehydrogenase medium subunit
VPLGVAAAEGLAFESAILVFSRVAFLLSAGAEALLVGHALGSDLTGRAIDAVRAAIAPETDLHASADYRRHLAGVLAGRALAAAWRRAKESSA